MIRRLYESAVVWSYVATVLRVGAGLLLLPLILVYLSEGDIAFWYVMTAMSQMVLQLDLGFTFTISRSASYLWAGANELKSIGWASAPIPKAQPNIVLLGNLIATFRLFYFLLAAVLIVVGVLLGYIYFAWTEQDVNSSSYSIMWGLFLLGIGINFSGLLWPALLTGLNHVRMTQQLFVVSLIGNYSVALCGLVLGGGLWALVAGQIVMGLMIRIGGEWLTRRVLHRAGWKGSGKRDTTLVRTLWGNAWRAGTVSVGAGMSREAPVYLCGLFFPASVTASLGVTFHMIRLIRQMALVWVQVKIPWMQQQWVTGHARESLALFKRRWAVATVVYVLGVAALWLAAPTLLRILDSDTTVLAGWPLAIIALFFLLDNNRSIFAQLIISMNQIPFWRSWLITGLLTWPVAYVSGITGNITVFLLSWLGLHALWVFWSIMRDALPVFSDVSRGG